MSLPPEQRHQMPAAFHHLVKRLRNQVLSGDEPLKGLLDAEAAWFDELRDVRDDICHRTAYGRVRTATFPELHQVLRAGGGVAPFLSAADLRGYVVELFGRILALSCVAEDFVYTHIRGQHPAAATVPPAIVIAEGEIDLAVSTKEPLFPLGTMIMTFSPTSLQNLEYFLDRPEQTA